MMEQVVLVNELDQEIGLMEKMEAHEKALLHRAFSVFVFNDAGELLLQQRAFEKYHSGGLWTNTCCSHPRANEAVLDAANRRLVEEMGFNTPLEKVLEFIYLAEFSNGLTEHEYDHVFIGQYNGTIVPDPNEVHAYEYRTMESIQASLDANEGLFTAWFEIIFPKMMDWWKNQNSRNLAAN
jgi:isopentenyl-diphosphate delta-isomerase